MKIFQSSKNYYMISFLWLIVILLLATPFLAEEETDDTSEKLIASAIIYLVTGMLIWMLLDTNYKIRNEQLFYCSGPLRGKIEIANIRKVEHWNKWYVTSFIKPALGNDGFIIHYNKFDDIFISPKNKEDFIAALRKINPEIEVV